jgi:hypothetical protein
VRHKKGTPINLRLLRHWLERRQSCNAKFQRWVTATFSQSPAAQQESHEKRYSDIKPYFLHLFTA